MNKLNSQPFIYLFFLLFSVSVFADQCPTPQIVKDRKISRTYDWTIDERRTLDDVLSVEKLYSVRIINKGEFIACYYSLPKGNLRLDGKPEKQDCLVKTVSGNWKQVNNDEQVCKEKDLSLCRYEIKCE